MDKIIWKSTREWPYFLDNVLMGIRIVFLSDYPLVLSLLKFRRCKGIFEQKGKRQVEHVNLRMVVFYFNRKL